MQHDAGIDGDHERARHPLQPCVARQRDGFNIGVHHLVVDIAFHQRVLSALDNCGAASMIDEHDGECAGMVLGRDRRNRVEQTRAGVSPSLESGGEQDGDGGDRPHHRQRWRLIEQ